MKREHSVGAAVLTVLWLAASAAAMPEQINYQGRLVDGTNLVNGPISLVLAIYDAETDGTLLYADSNTVTVVDGLYATYIGDDTVSGTLTGALAAAEAWLEVSVNGTTLSPRERLAAVPYALTAAGVEDGSIAASDVDATSFNTTFWRAGGNAGTTPGTHYLGTSDNTPLELRANHLRVLRFEPSDRLEEYSDSPNVIAGHPTNTVTPGACGGTIAGGGSYAGAWNRVTDDFGAIGGGRNNQAGDNADTVTNAWFATVGGGRGNTAGGAESVVAGGKNNQALGSFSSVLGGSGNMATGEYSVIGGGINNHADALMSFVGGGHTNLSLGHLGAIVGGELNEIHALLGFVGGGSENKVYTNCSGIVGGYQNISSNVYTSIGGGAWNYALGAYSTVPGGRGNTAEGNYSVACGYQSAATHVGEFAHSSGNFSERGDAQASEYVLRRTTTGASAYLLFLNGGDGTPLTLASNRVVAFDSLITAAADNGDAAVYRYSGGIKRVGVDPVQMIGSVSEDLVIEDDSSWLVEVNANTNDNSLRFRVTGATGRTIRWVAAVRTTETVIP